MYMCVEPYPINGACEAWVITVWPIRLNVPIKMIIIKIEMYCFLIVEKFWLVNNRIIWSLVKFGFS